MGLVIAVLFVAIGATATNAEAAPKPSAKAELALPNVRVIAEHFAPKSQVHTEIEFGPTIARQSADTDSDGSSTALIPIPEGYVGIANIRVTGKAPNRFFGLIKGKKTTVEQSTSDSSPLTTTTVASTTTEAPSTTATSTTAALATTTPTTPAPVGTPAPAPTTGPSGPPTQNSTVLFDAKFNSAFYQTAPSGSRSWGEYSHLVPQGQLTFGKDFGVARDPSGKSNRQVVWTTNQYGHQLTGTDPRSQLRKTNILKPAARGNTVDEYWESVSFYWPSQRVGTNGQIVDNRMPRDKWHAVFTGAWGQPYGGSSTLVFGADAVDDKHFRLRPNERQTGRVDKGTNEFAYDTWIQIMVHFKFAYDGWVEVWANDGPDANSWQPFTWNGQRRVAAPTLRQGINDAWYRGETNEANEIGLGSYGDAAIFMYFGGQKLATGGPSGVALDDYGTWNGALPK